MNPHPGEDEAHTDPFGRLTRPVLPEGADEDERRAFAVGLDVMEGVIRQLAAIRDDAA